MNKIKVERLDRNVHLAVLQERVRKEFARHKIIHRDNRSWTCMQLRPDGSKDSHFWFEAVVLYGGTLLVNGDIDLMHFAYYGKYEDPREVLNWMGRCKDVGYYVAQKARIGLTQPSTDHLVESYDNNVWMDDAFDYLEHSLSEPIRVDTSKEVDLDELRKIAPAWWVDLVEFVDEHSLPTLLAESQSELCEVMTHDAWEAGAADWGRVTSSRLVVAHEALRCLVRLLDEEEAAAKVAPEATAP